jgi:hypothetical protein
MENAELELELEMEVEVQVEVERRMLVGDGQEWSDWLSAQVVGWLAGGRYQVPRGGLALLGWRA